MKKFTFLVFPGIFSMIFLAISAVGQNYSYPDAWDQQGFILKESKSNGALVNFSITEFSLVDIIINGEKMKDVSLPGNFLFNDAGAPNLPGNGKIIAIPQGSIPELEIISSRTEVFQDVDIAPAPVIPRDDEKGPLTYRKDDRIYSTDAFYPVNPVTLSSPMKIRGVDAVMLGITPFQYNPVTKEMIIYRDIKVSIRFVGGTGIFGEDRLRSRWWDPILEDAIFNYSMLPEIDYDRRYSNLNPLETGAEYLIITPNGAAFLQYADSIMKFRTEQGILTMVKTLTEVGGNTTTAIENYINNAYNTWTIPPAAILLLGDYGTDINSTVISPIYDSYCVSDNIYADVDGNQLPEIVLARITANNQAQLQVMVSKFLNYERNPPTSAAFYAHPITALGWQTERWFQICSEVVGGFWKNVQGKFPVRINAVYGGNPTIDPWSTATNTTTVLNYFGPSGLGYIPATPQELGGWTGGNATAINTAINAGAFMLQHRDHGAETGWGEPAYSSTNINGLVNTDLSFIMSINCLTGKYNYSSEVFAEKFHRYTYNGQNSGALGIMAASEVSYSFVNDVYVWGMFDNMWPNFMPAYGTTPASRGILPAFGNAAGKIFLQQSSWPYNTGDKEVTYHLFHHHGDAFLTVYSEVPQNLTVSHSPVLYAGFPSFEVTANSGSLIALTLNGVIIGTATGTGSPISISIPPQVPPDQMIVTVTKQNFFRYRSVVNVVPASGPYVVYASHTINDPLPGGNNNHQMDYGETNLLSVSLNNVGILQAANVNVTLSSTNPYITITDNTENYGNINPSQTILQANAFSYSVASNIPDQQVVAFDVNAVSDTSTWISHFNITANAPSLSIGATSVSDPAPGGNGNGILDPGETGDLIIVTTNSGHTSIDNVISSLAIVGGSSPYLTINNGTFTIGTLATGGSANATFNVTVNNTTPNGTPVDLICSATGGSSGQYTASSPKQFVIGCSPCASTSNNATMEWISNVTFNTINNTSAGNTGYQDFTSISTSVTPGSPYTLSITCDETSTWTEHIWAFIDWNKDCDFTDVGESYDLGQVSAPGTLTTSVTVPAGATPGYSRFRASLKYAGDPNSCETFSYGQVEDYTVIVPNPVKTLNLKVYLEGLYNGAGTMRQAYDATGPHFGTGIADHVIVELHYATVPYGVAYTYTDVNLNTDGTLSIRTIPVTATGSYYIVVKNRNHIETWSAGPVAFNGSGPFAYDFSTSASQAYGSNMKQIGTIYAVWAGDVTQDGLVDGSDMSSADNACTSILKGYIIEDANGDGLVDGSDMTIIDNNSNAIVTVQKPE